MRLGGNRSRVSLSKRLFLRSLTFTDFLLQRVHDSRLVFLRRLLRDFQWRATSLPKWRSLSLQAWRIDDGDVTQREAGEAGYKEVASFVTMSHTGAFFVKRIACLMTTSYSAAYIIAGATGWEREI